MQTFLESLVLGLIRYRRVLLAVVVVGLLVLILGKAGCSVPRFGRGGQAGAPANQAIEQAIEQAQVRGLPAGATPFPTGTPALRVEKTLGDRLGFLWGWLPWLLGGGLIFWVLNRIFGGLGMGGFIADWLRVLRPGGIAGGLADLLGGANGNGNGNGGP